MEQSDIIHAVIKEPCAHYLRRRGQEDALPAVPEVTAKGHHGARLATRPGDRQHSPALWQQHACKQACQFFHDADSNTKRGSTHPEVPGEERVDRVELKTANQHQEGEDP